MRPTTEQQETHKPATKPLRFDCVWTERFTAIMQRVFQGGAWLCLVCTFIVGFDLLAPGVERARTSVFETQLIKPGKEGPRGLVQSSQYGNRRYTPTSIAAAANRGDSISIIYFGSFIDRFGINWMINCANQANSKSKSLSAVTRSPTWHASGLFTKESLGLFQA